MSLRICLSRKKRPRIAPGIMANSGLSDTHISWSKFKSKRKKIEPHGAQKREEHGAQKSVKHAAQRGLNPRPKRGVF